MEICLEEWGIEDISHTDTVSGASDYREYEPHVPKPVQGVPLCDLPGCIDHNYDGICDGRFYRMADVLAVYAHVSDDGGGMRILDRRRYEGLQGNDDGEMCQAWDHADGASQISQHYQDEWQEGGSGCIEDSVYLSDRLSGNCDRIGSAGVCW